MSRSVFLFVATWMLLLCVASGCYTVVRDETFDYREPERVRRDQLRTDGYYCTKRYYSESSNIFTGTTVQCFIFWQDGTSVSFSGAGRVKKDEVGNVVLGSFEEAHQAFRTRLDSISALPSWGERDPSSPYWGAYRIRGDSIFIQSMADAVSGGFSHRYVAAKDTGTVLSDTTFVLESVFKANACPGDTTEVCRGTYRYRRLDTKPDSTNWLHERYR
jgi:hypothetical protein